MAEKRIAKWWVIIQDDSWLTNSHGAFSLGFLTKNDLLGKERKTHLQCQACK